jgi:hypothetical protein
MRMGFKRGNIGRPLWAALLSGLVAPGIGQIFNRDFVKGIFLLVASVGSFLWFSKVCVERLAVLLPGNPEEWATNQTVFKEALTKLITQNPDMFMTFELLIIIVWVYGIIDAYATARRHIVVEIKTPDKNNSDSLS